ncbi:DUF2066 domain-containing protein [Endozoicomonadaceae bacterium StTr2]
MVFNGCFAPLFNDRLQLFGKLVLAVLVWLLLGATTVRAANQVSLYNSVKPVSGQTATEREQAVRQSLATVFVRITGNREVLSQPSVKEALTRANDYVSSYHYNRDAENQTQLEVRFDSASLNDFLRRQGIPLWGSTRPETMVWFALEENGKRHILDSRQSDVLEDVLRAQENERGLSFLFPVMDLEDAANVQVADVWGLFDEPLVKGSQRYGAAVILAGRIYPQGKGYSGRLALFLQGRRAYFDFSGLTFEQLAELAADRLAVSLSDIYAVVQQEQSDWVALQVGGIETVKDYAGVLEYLKKLAIVREVGPSRAKGSSLVLQARIDGDRSQLAAAIALEHVLQPVKVEGTPAGVSPEGNMLEYIWRPGR